METDLFTTERDTNQHKDDHMITAQNSWVLVATDHNKF